MAEKGIKYIGMGVSGGEEGARNGAHPLVSIRAFHPGPGTAFQWHTLHTGTGHVTLPSGGDWSPLVPCTC